MTSRFQSTLQTFCTELSLTLPELAPVITRAATTTTPTQFWKGWVRNLEILLLRDSDRLFAECKGFIVGAVRITPALWGELSPGTQNVIWTYLRTLCLEAAKEVGLEAMDGDTLQALNNILLAERMESDPEATTSEMFEESMRNLQPMMDRIKELLGSDFSAGVDPADLKLPELPPHLKAGCIARLAELLVKQLDPAEFGIDPELLKSDKVEEVLQRLMEMFQRDPAPMQAGLQRLAEKIRGQIVGGTLDQKALIAEAKEYMELFKEHPLFKKVMARFKGAGPMMEMFNTMMSGGGPSSGEPSERLRITRERLRRKFAARQGGGGGSKK